MIVIYGLQDPLTSEVRYVGMTGGPPKKRCKDHIDECRHPYKKGNNLYKYGWIKSLLKQGKEPEVFVLEETDEENWSFWEEWWRQYLVSIGCRLTNIIPGGTKPPNLTGRIHSPTERENIKRALNLPEVRERHSRGLRNKKKSVEHIKKLKEISNNPTVKAIKVQILQREDVQKKRIEAVKKNLTGKKHSNEQNEITHTTTVVAMSQPDIRSRHLEGIRRYWFMRKMQEVNQC